MSPRLTWDRTLNFGLAAGMASALALTGGVVLAQTQLPGLVVTVPPVERPGAAPAPPPPPAATEAPRAKPKPKPEPKAERKRPAATAIAGTDEGGPAVAGSGINAGRAAVKVNGEPITTYEIEQRARLLSLQANIGQRAQENLKRIVSSDSVNARWKQIVDDTIKNNQGKSRDDILKILEQRKAELGASLQRQAVDSAKASVLPGLRKQAREELIEEAIKQQEGRRAGIKVDESDVNVYIKNLADNNKMTIPQLEKHFGGMGVDLSTLRSKFRTNLAWAEVIRRKYSYLVNPNQREIDKLVGNNAQSGEDEVEFQLQRILISVPAKIDQRTMAQKFVEAEGMRSSFSNCKALAGLTAKAQGSRLENIGTRRPANFQEPTRTLLANAKVDEMLPPNVTTSGIELIAVCGRKVVKADEKRRAEAASEIRQKEFEIQARRLLRDLQQDAIIENIGQ